jgi:hypothetical protein
MGLAVSASPVRGCDQQYGLPTRKQGTTCRSHYESNHRARGNPTPDHVQLRIDPIPQKHSDRLTVLRLSLQGGRTPCFREPPTWIQCVNSRAQLETYSSTHIVRYKSQGCYVRLIVAAHIRFCIPYTSSLFLYCFRRPDDCDPLHLTIGRPSGWVPHSETPLGAVNGGSSETFVGFSFGQENDATRIASHHRQGHGGVE